MTLIKGYDTTEAFEIAARAADEARPDIAGREAATKSLFDAVADTATRAGIGAEVKGGSLFIGSPRHDGARVRVFSDEHKIMIQDDAQNREDVALTYNAARKMWEGWEPDQARTPMPGEPSQLRSAAAVVMEKALGFFRATR